MYGSRAPPVPVVGINVAAPPFKAWNVVGLSEAAVKRKTCGTSPLKAAAKNPAAADGSLEEPWGRACAKTPRASKAAKEYMTVKTADSLTR